MESEKDFQIDVCIECKVRDGDSSKKKVFKCGLCERWFCEKHIEPRLAFIRDLEAMARFPEIRVMLDSEWNREDGHPDFAYSRKKFEEIEMEEKKRNELIKQALDRMNRYYAEAEILEEPIDVEADRKKRVETLLKEEREKEAWEKEVAKFPKEVETVQTAYGFPVPLEVYLNPEYREYLDHADNMKSVKVIVEEYYRKYGKRKKLEEFKKRVPSEGKAETASSQVETQKPHPKKDKTIVTIIATLALITTLVGIIIWIVPHIQQSAYTKLTLPIGSFVSYNPQEGNSNLEYTFRYGGPLGDEPDLLQVWAENNILPKEFSVIKGATYTAFAIEIIISEVHQEYIVILVKPLS